MSVPLHVLVVGSSNPPRRGRGRPLGRKHVQCRHECFCASERGGLYMPCWACQECEQKQRAHARGRRNPEMRFAFYLLVPGKAPQEIRKASLPSGVGSAIWQRLHYAPNGTTMLVQDLRSGFSASFAQTMFGIRDRDVKIALGLAQLGEAGKPGSPADLHSKGITQLWGGGRSNPRGRRNHPALVAAGLLPAVKSGVVGGAAWEYGVKPAGRAARRTVRRRNDPLFASLGGNLIEGIAAGVGFGIAAPLMGRAIHQPRTTRSRGWRENPDLSGNVWADERRLRAMFSWFTKLGVAPHFGRGTSIAHYQADQAAAFDLLEMALRREGFPTGAVAGQKVRARNGIIEAWGPKQGAGGRVGFGWIRIISVYDLQQGVYSTGHLVGDQQRAALMAYLARVSSFPRGGRSWRPGPRGNPRQVSVPTSRDLGRSAARGARAVDRGVRSASRSVAGSAREFSAGVREGWRSNPEVSLPSHKKKGTISIQEALRRNIPGIREAIAGFKKFHGCEPTGRITIYDDGREDSVAGFYMGRSPEAVYDKTPRGSNKHGSVWVHKMKNTVMAHIPKTGETKFVGPVRVSDWMRGG